ncbi:hypothetical protein C1645_495269 [Glomus cerebriforme]|uniref:Btz domain-containing protein n=1 Tax=Glomus cerebriforme TaxID=658196 RepID=A0A397TFZ3_9GLOM|nr:hypothetical protein C1645_495269 [Glomus cerebriforme]
MKIEDEERRRKEFQRRIQHRREFVPPAPRRFHNNITPPKSNYSRPSNSIRKRRNSFEEQSRSRGMFLSAKNKRGNINSNNFNNHKSSIRESRSENSYNSNSRNVTSTSRFSDSKSFAGKGRNGFRGRGYSSRHYMRSSLNRDHSFNSNHAETDGKHSINQDKNSKKQHSNNDDVDNIKGSHVVHNTGQQECHENEFEDNKNTIAEYQIEKVELVQDPTDATSRVDITSGSHTEERMEPGSPIKEQKRVYEKSDENFGVENNFDSQNKKAIEDNATHSTLQSINNVTSSFNDLSINNNQSDIIGSLPSTLIDKDRVQINQASKRYSTRRAASFSITQPAQTNDPSVSGIPNNSRTSEIPPSAVFAPPFQPRALALSDENSISNEDSPDNCSPQKPETPITYYMDNVSQGLSNNLLSENNLPQSTSIPPVPVPYGTESNGMVYYYDPNMYYYYYPGAHTTPELKDTNDNSVKPSSFIPQPSTTVPENDSVYYYYHHPVYYQ